MVEPAAWEPALQHFDMTIAPTACPSCRAAVTPGDTICLSCGLLLASAAPATAAPPAPPRPGTIGVGTSLAGGRFTVVRPLGRGGMGALYLATDHSAFERPVVIKTLLDPGDPAEAHEARERFIGEARMLARLKYPTIPQIFAHFTEGPHACIVMEYVEGRDLQQGLSRRNDDGTVRPGQPYPLDDVLRWGVDVCRMLEYLARQQPPIVHQDIKPANLVLDSHSHELFLVDFGTVRSHRIGTAAAAFGTPGYAPPEQYQGRGEPRSDVYALAATLYHLATDDDPGEHPFQFPHLDTLGPFGAVLRPALGRDPSGRPDAAGLRRGLEAVAGAPSGSLTARVQARAAPHPTAAPAVGRAPLKTIDGAELHAPAELAAWCERNWEQAMAWLYTSLPGRVEGLWGDVALARRLSQVVDQYARPRAGLDAALVILDPAGYGASPPQLTADTQQIDFGVVRGRERRWLLVRNTGRRYVEAEVKATGPLIVDIKDIRLAPGEQATVVVTAEMGHYPKGQQVQQELLVLIANQPALRVATRAEAGGGPPLLVSIDSTIVWIIAMVVFAAVMLVLVLVLARL
jgi:serine/threonine protein kinase